jgi:hypothetical protein
MDRNLDLGSPLDFSVGVSQTVCSEDLYTELIVLSERVKRPSLTHVFGCLGMVLIDTV